MSDQLPDSNAPRKKMSLIGPMGLSVIVHGLIIVGVGYFGVQSLKKGEESVSEMEIGKMETPAEQTTVPLDVETVSTPQPVTPSAPEPVVSEPEPVPPVPVVETKPAPTPAAALKQELAPRIKAPPVAVVPEPEAPPVPTSEAEPEAQTAPEAVAPAEEEPKPVLAPPVEESLETAKNDESSREEAAPQSQPEPPVAPPVGEVAETDAASEQAVESPGLPEGVISDSQLSPLKTSRPEYPMAEKMKGHQGDVILLYSLQNDGSISNIRIFKSSGFKNLDMSAARALSQYRYPGGRTAEVIKTFSFRLKGPSVEAPSRWRKSN